MGFGFGLTLPVELVLSYRFIIGLLADVIFVESSFGRFEFSFFLRQKVLANLRSEQSSGYV